MKKFAHYAALASVGAEWAITLVPFFLSWFLCAIYRSILNGWSMSGAQGEVKAATLRQLWGGK